LGGKEKEGGDVEVLGGVCDVLVMILAAHRGKEARQGVITSTDHRVCEMMQGFFLPFPFPPGPSPL
jgi:hypothetical protein